MLFYVIEIIENKQIFVINLYQDIIYVYIRTYIVIIRRKKMNKIPIERALLNDKKRSVNLLLNEQQLPQYQSIAHIRHGLP